MDAPLFKAGWRGWDLGVIMDKEEKVFRINELINQRIINEDRLLAERSNIFLLASSILFAGFVMVMDKSKLLAIVIPTVGIFLTVLMWNASWNMVRELSLWLAMSQKIEQEEEAFQDLKERERIPHSAWNYWWMGESTYIRTEKHPLYMNLPPVSCWEKLLPFGILAPWNMYKFYLPGAFFVIWAAALIWVINYQGFDVVSV